MRMNSVTTVTFIATILLCNDAECRPNHKEHDGKCGNKHMHGYRHNEHRNKEEDRYKEKDETERMHTRRFKYHNASVERRALASLERVLVRAKMGEKGFLHKNQHSNTVHHNQDHTEQHMTSRFGYRGDKRTPLHDHHHGKETPKIDSDYDGYGSSFEDKELSTSSSGILNYLEDRHRRLITRSSEFYDRQNYDSFLQSPPPDLSISSDYHSWEKYYEDLINNNHTTAHYAWWTYDPNETCEWFNGRPLNMDRMLYSIKMSTLLPANISAEVDAVEPDYIDSKYVRQELKSREEFFRDNATNKYGGPDPNRRELDRWELLRDDIGNLEYTMADRMDRDIKRYIKKPLLKGLYHFKKWMNPNYFTTTPKIELTWGKDTNSQELIRQYKKYLKVEKNISVPEDAGKSIFEKYTFTADSNYYCETREDMPRRVPDSFYPSSD